MLSKRSSEKEQMDNFEWSGTELDKTLNGLSTINKYLGNTSATFKALKSEILKINKSLKIVDLGCGGGDNLRAIADWCLVNNHPIELVGIDGNPHILENAKKKSTQDHRITYIQADILDAAFVLPKCDILISSHFVYHFSDSELVGFLNRSQSRVASKIIFSELQRNYIPYALFKLAGVFLPFSDHVKQDGLIAIKRAFTKAELIFILRKTNFIEYEIKRKWAFRFLIAISVNE